MLLKLEFVFFLHVEKTKVCFDKEIVIGFSLPLSSLSKSRDFHPNNFPCCFIRFLITYTESFPCYQSKGVGLFFLKQLLNFLYLPVKSLSLWLSE